MATPAEQLVQQAAENAPQLRLIVGGAATVAGTGATVGAATAFSPIIIGIIVLAVIVLIVGVLVRIPVVKGWANDAGNWLRDQFSHMIAPVVRIGDSLNRTLEQGLFATPWAIGELGDYLAWGMNHKLPSMINGLRAEEDGKILSIFPLIGAVQSQLANLINGVEQRATSMITTVRDQALQLAQQVTQFFAGQLDSIRNVEIPAAIRPLAIQIGTIVTTIVPNIMKFVEFLHNEQAQQIGSVSQQTQQVAQQLGRVEDCIPLCGSVVSDVLRGASEDPFDLLSEFGGLVFTAIAIPGVPRALNAIRKRADDLAVAAGKLLGE